MASPFALPNFYYGHCMKYGSAHGELNSCLIHGNVPYLLEGMLIHKGAILTSATVPWHWLFFALPRSHALKICLEIMIP